MGGKLKGITVEIGGNTTKLGTALKGVESQTRSLQNELKGTLLLAWGFALNFFDIIHQSHSFCIRFLFAAC